MLMLTLLDYQRITEDNRKMTRPMHNLYICMGNTIDAHARYEARVTETGIDEWL